MGMYTHLVLNVDFTENVPDEVVNVINFMVGNSEKRPEHSNHPFFETVHWRWCLVQSSAYFMGVSNTAFKKGEYDPYWHLTVNANCKNYDNEYEKFLDYIQPYISRHELLGFMRYEEWDYPTLIFNDWDAGIRYEKCIEE